MSTDTAVMEQALVVMAIAMSVQALLLVAGAIAAVVAWRKTVLAMAEARTALELQGAYLRGHLDRLSATVEDVAGSVRRSSSTVNDAVTDVRDVMGTVGNGLSTVASVVTAPRAAVALGLWRGLGVLRRKRRESRHAAAAAAAQL